MPAAVQVLILVVQALLPLIAKLPEVAKFFREVGDELDAMGDSDPTQEQVDAIDARLKGAIARLEAANADRRE